MLTVNSGSSHLFKLTKSFLLQLILFVSYWGKQVLQEKKLNKMSPLTFSCFILLERVHYDNIEPTYESKFLSLQEMVLEHVYLGHVPTTT